MSEKQLFLDKLRAALIERDISDSDIQPYIERFDRFYDRMVSDPENTKNGLLDDIDRIADNIAEQVSERYDEINRLAERTLTVDRVKDVPDQPPQNSVGAEENRSGEQPGRQPETSTSADADNQPKPGNAHSGAPGNLPADQKNAPDSFGNASGTFNEMAEAYDDVFPDGKSNRPPEYIDEEPSPNSTIFWVLFAVSLPLTLPLALIGLAFFAGVWVGFLGLIIGAVALLIGSAAVGTALALVGIIYGISQLFSVVPVGMYELGLGVMIGSATMFVGILLYNFAIRLMPVIMRLWGRFFRFVCAKLRLLFGFLRKECAKL